jgi:hypothetical protein
MEELKNFLESPQKSYSVGVKLYNKFDSKKNHNSYFSNFKTGKKGDAHYDFLIERLLRIARINNLKFVWAKTTSFDEAKPEIKQQSNAELIVNYSRQLTNKLLAYDWKNLEYKDKLYFKNNEAMFLQKKGLYIEISKFNDAIKGLHAKLSTLKDGKEKENIANEILNLKTAIEENFKKIDNFEVKNIQNSEISSIPKKTRGRKSKK